MAGLTATVEEIVFETSVAESGLVAEAAEQHVFAIVKESKFETSADESYSTTTAKDC